MQKAYPERAVLKGSGVSMLLQRYGHCLYCTTNIEKIFCMYIDKNAYISNAE